MGKRADLNPKEKLNSGISCGASVKPLRDGGEKLSQLGSRQGRRSRSLRPNSAFRHCYTPEGQITHYLTLTAGEREGMGIYLKEAVACNLLAFATASLLFIIQFSAFSIHYIHYSSPDDLTDTPPRRRPSGREEARSSEGRRETCSPRGCR